MHFNPDPQTWFSSCKHVTEIRCLQEEIWWLQKEDVRSDDEVELLINIAADYKALKAAESVDLESVCHTHYITQLFVRIRYQLFSVFSIYM